MASPNWNRIKAEYLKGGTSYAKLADKHGVSKRTIERRAIKEDWASACRQFVAEVSAELPSKVAAIVLDEAERVTRSHIELFQKAQNKATFLLDQVADIGELKDWATATKTIQQCQRLALGLDSKQEGGKADDDGSAKQVYRTPAKRPLPPRD